MLVPSTAWAFSHIYARTMCNRYAHKGKTRTHCMEMSLYTCIWHKRQEAIGSECIHAFVWADECVDGPVRKAIYLCYYLLLLETLLSPIGEHFYIRYWRKFPYTFIVIPWARTGSFHCWTKLSSLLQIFKWRSRRHLAPSGTSSWLECMPKAHTLRVQWVFAIISCYLPILAISY